MVSLREGKNREIKNVLAALGLTVNRLIRVSFGPFQLNDLPIGAVEVVKARVLRDQLGKRIADEAGVDFDSELPEPAAIKLARGAANPALRASKPGAEPARQRKAMADRTERFRFTDRPDREQEFHPEKAPLRKDRPGSRFPRKPAPPAPTWPPMPVRRARCSTRTAPKPCSRSRPTARSRAPPVPGAEGDKPPFRKSFGDKPRDAGSRRSSPARSDAGSRRSSPARSAGEGGPRQAWWRGRP